VKREKRNINLSDSEEISMLIHINKLPKDEFKRLCELASVQKCGGGSIVKRMYKIMESERENKT